jgi:hypothetical protein
MPAKAPAAPKKIKIAKDHEKWNNCVDWVVSGKDVDALRQWYDISKETEEAIIAEATVRTNKTE